MYIPDVWWCQGSLVLKLVNSFSRRPCAAPAQGGICIGDQSINQSEIHHIEIVGSKACRFASLCCYLSIYCHLAKDSLYTYAPCFMSSSNLYNSCRDEVLSRKKTPTIQSAILVLMRIKKYHQKAHSNVNPITSSHQPITSSNPNLQCLCIQLFGDVPTAEHHTLQ